jgi:hypothetical protein
LDKDEDLLQLDTDIKALSVDNSEKLRQNIALRAEIARMESSLQQHTQSTELLRSKSNGVVNDLAYLRRQLIHSLADIPLPTTNETLREDNFDSYMRQLRELCVDKFSDENRDLLNAVKQALSAIPV